jgi:hypothetical protein
LAQEFKGLEFEVWELSCKEYMVSVDMSCPVGPHGQDKKPVTREAPRSWVMQPTLELGSFQMGGPSSLVRSGGAIPDTGCMAPRLFWPLEGTERT